jgi:hypothetical protein
MLYYAKSREMPGAGRSLSVLGIETALYSFDFYIEENKINPPYS